MTEIKPSSQEVINKYKDDTWDVDFLSDVSIPCLIHECCGEQVTIDGDVQDGRLIWTVDGHRPDSGWITIGTFESLETAKSAAMNWLWTKEIPQ